MAGLQHNRKYHLITINERIFMFIINKSNMLVSTVTILFTRCVVVLRAAAGQQTTHPPAWGPGSELCCVTLRLLKTEPVASLPGVDMVDLHLLNYIRCKTKYFENSV